ncbi:MAG: diaminopimelate epimerase [Candidatus Marinimicrobia bacterium]|nr:diaminopimelate epimerase [Candidatus Neomarinimicrobiota bacterium]
MKFYKYQAQGNDYIVVDPKDLKTELSTEQIITICHPHYGIGSDGLLVGPYNSDRGDFGLRLFNPDGGEFEKSGNGLCIFSRYLRDQQLVTENEFTIDTPGGLVQARVHEDGRAVTIAMGQVSFDSEKIPVEGPQREVLNEILIIDGQDYRYCAATIGNPHCVVLLNEISPELARRIGPIFETAPRFPNRTNVQFLEVLDRNNIRIEIWERGVGYTLASGSSSCAAAAVANRLGYCDRQITVHCAGGDIKIKIAADFIITMTGAVTNICSGELAAEIFDF